MTFAITEAANAHLLEYTSLQELEIEIEKEMGIIAEYLIELKRDVKSQEVIALRTLESQTKFKKEVTSIVSKIKPPISKKSPTTAKKRSSKKRAPKTLKGK